MCALHVEGDQLAQRVAAVAIRPEAIAAGLQPVGEELRERGVVLEHDELGHVRGLDGRSGGRHRLGERGGRGRGRGRLWHRHLDRCRGLRGLGWRSWLARGRRRLRGDGIARYPARAPGVWPTGRYGWRGREFRRSEEHTSELQSPCNLVCRLLLEKKKKRRT